MSGAVTRVMPARGTVLMPVAKLSPISQATISITPWMPKVNISDSTGSPVKFVMPSQVVQPPARESTIAAVPSMASCQLVKKTSSITRHSRGPTLNRAISAAMTTTVRRMLRAYAAGFAITPSRACFTSICVSRLGRPMPDPARRIAAQKSRDDAR